MLPDSTLQKQRLSWGVVEVRCTAKLTAAAAMQVLLMIAVSECNCQYSRKVLAKPLARVEFELRLGNHAHVPLFTVVVPQ